MRRRAERGRIRPATTRGRMLLFLTLGVLAVMTVIMLLTSCATPPATRAIASIRSPCTRTSAARRRSVTSLTMHPTHSVRPSAVATG